MGDAWAALNAANKPNPKFDVLWAKLNGSKRPTAPKTADAKPPAAAQVLSASLSYTPCDSFPDNPLGEPCGQRDGVSASRR
jgi:hypothetical protein